MGVLEDLLHLETLGARSNEALGRGGNQVLLGLVTVIQLAHASDELDISILVGSPLFDVQVEAVDDNLGLGCVLVIEGSRLGICRLVRSKRSPHPFSKLFTSLRVGQRVVNSCPCRVATDREEHLLAPELAVGDIKRDLVAVGEKLRVLAIHLVHSRVAVGTEVGSGVAGARRVLLGGRDDEGDGDVLEAGGVAVGPQTVASLLAPVHVDGWSCLGDSRQGRKGKG